MMSFFQVLNIEEAKLKEVPGMSELACPPALLLLTLRFSVLKKTIFQHLRYVYKINVAFVGTFQYFGTHSA